MWHWTGSWHNISPALGVKVNGVWGAASNDVWTVGDGILHYDGTNWSNKIPVPGEEIVTIPNSSPYTVQLSHDVKVGTAPSHKITLTYVPDSSTTLTEVSPGPPNSGEFTCTDGGLLTFNSAGAGQQYRANYTALIIDDTTLNAIWGWAADDIFAVGDGGVILHYDGSGWSEMMAVPTSANLYDVYGNDNEVMAVGAGGVILRYDGIIWSQVQPIDMPPVDLRGVWLSNDDPAVGWAVGAGGTYLKYSGGDWTLKRIVESHKIPASSPYTVTLSLGVLGTSPNHNIIVKDTSTSPVSFTEVEAGDEDDGKFSCTDLGVLTFAAGDADTNITVTYTPTPDLYDIWGASADEFWAVGQKDTILHYVGGVWSDESLTTAGGDLHGIWGLPGGTNGPEMYAVGNKRTCLHYQPAAPAHPGVPEIFDAAQSVGGPANGATVLSAQPFLNFSSADTTHTTGKVLKYTIYLDGRSKTLAGKFASGKKVHWRVPINWALAPGTSHKWKVAARCTKSGTTTTGPEWTFQTGEYPYITCISPSPPSSAEPGYRVHIFGENFGDTRGQVRLQTKVPNLSPPPATKTVFQYINGDFGTIRYWGSVDDAVEHGWVKPNLIPCAPDLVIIELPSAAYWSTQPWVLPKTYGVQVQKVGGGAWSSPANLSITW
jgi:hypothetical protein